MVDYIDEDYSDTSEFDAYLDSLDEDERQKYSMSALEQGTPTHVNLTYYKKQRLGETNTSYEGYSLEIVDYRNTGDIDVLVDGTEVVTSTYTQFISGSIHNPRIARNRSHFKAKIGEKTVSMTGEVLEIVDYRGCHDVDILVDGKYLIQSTTNAYFQSAVKEKARVDAKTKANAEARARAKARVESRAMAGVDAKTMLKAEAIARAEARAKERLGKKGMSRAGYTMEIVAYRSDTDIDILIDGKVLVTGRSYPNFMCGSIRNPDAPTIPWTKYWCKGRCDYMRENWDTLKQPDVTPACFEDCRILRLGKTGVDA